MTVLRDDYKSMPSDLFDMYHGGMDLVADPCTGEGVPKMRPDAPCQDVPCKYGCGKMLGYRPGLDEYRGYDPSNYACIPCGMANRGK
jgi:hypothetical protein